MTTASEENSVSKYELRKTRSTLNFFYKQLRIFLELGLLNSETEIGTGVA